MNKVYLLLLLFILSFDSNGQWYQNYGVNDINQLSRDQLEESLKKANKMSYWGVGCILIGVICLPIGAVYLEKANNPTSSGFLAGLDDGIRAEGFFCASALTIIPGSVLIISSNHRRKLIQPVLNNYNINHSYSDISPAILFNDYKQSFVPGFVISIKF